MSLVTSFLARYPPNPVPFLTAGSRTAILQGARSPVHPFRKDPRPRSSAGSSRLHVRTNKTGLPPRFERRRLCVACLSLLIHIGEILSTPCARAVHPAEALPSLSRVFYRLVDRNSIVRVLCHRRCEENHTRADSAKRPHMPARRSEKVAPAEM